MMIDLRKGSSDDDDVDTRYTKWEKKKTKTARCFDTHGVVEADETQELYR